MAYKLKSKKSAKISSHYFEEQELAGLRKKYPKGIPLSEASRFGMRQVSGVTERVHRKGNFVEYKNGLARIDKVEKKGIWVTPFHTNGIATPSKKKVFISEEKIEKGKVYPAFTNLPIMSLPFLTVK